MPMRKLFNLFLFSLVVMIVTPAGGYAADDPSPPLTCMVSICGEQTPELVASEIATFNVCPVELRVMDAYAPIHYAEIRAGDLQLRKPNLFNIDQWPGSNALNYKASYTPNINTDKLPEIRRL